MRIAVVSDEKIKEELLAQVSGEELEIIHLEAPAVAEGTEHYFDLLFDSTDERIQQWKNIPAKIVFVNAMTILSPVLPANFIRINGWPTFLKRPVTEAYVADPLLKEQAEKIFSLLHKKIEWTPDVPGFITARVISMIINEAYFALDENVSSKEEIDIAMRSGTNYPYGPFEWGQKIGLSNIYQLLKLLSKTNSRYEPSGLLKKEAAQ